jgi:UDP-N-acetylglucosamine--N-acetylmuramyl-(pentapeptide) pyrophosphoryl-undecaprenol N-acetylglucosamine transferase
VLPALAVADAYRALHPGAVITFLGTPLGLEGEIIPAAGYHIELIPGWPLFRSGLRGKARAVTQTLAGASTARRIFEQGQVQALLSFGGYASAGPVLAARRMRIPIAIHEPNVAPGLSNRLLARLADAITIGWPAAAAAFAGRNAHVTGVPIRGALSDRRPRRLPRADRVRHLLVLGGSMGSAFLNRRVPDVAQELTRRGWMLQVRHQCGSGGEDLVRRLYAEHGIDAGVASFVADIGSLYDWADVAITSAGAVTLAELAASALPALVVPLAVASEDHQAANARTFSAASGCPWVTEHAWNVATAADRVDQLFKDERHYAGVSAQLDAIASRDAATAVARVCDALIAGASCR